MFWMIIVLLFFVPLGIVALVAVLSRWQRNRAGRRSPINAKVLFGPGEQLRQRLAVVEEKISDMLLLFTFVGPYAFAIWAFFYIDWNEVHFRKVGAVLLVVVAMAMTSAIKRLLDLGEERRRLSEGLLAEQFTGQELNRLAGHGCVVFHDVPADGFNLDHVVIGPSAVFMVETKSFKKPKKDAGKDTYKVQYDGKGLRFPDFATVEPIEQARSERDWLAGHLEKIVGRRVPVFATVALPGWWIDYVGSGAPDVRVFNPAKRGAVFMANQSGVPLDMGTRGLIAQALVMRYPEDSPAV